jgi:hypothetical protein
VVAKSIPASADVTVIPGVLGTGGSALVLNGLIGTLSTRVPIGTVLFLAGLQAVQNFFGVNSAEAAMAKIYFSGFNNGTLLPRTLGFAQYNETAVAGYLRSGPGLTLSAIQAVTGVLTVSIDGTPYTTASINLSSATSFSNAATLIQTALVTAGATTATCTYDSQLGEFLITSGTTGGSSSVGFATGSFAAPMFLTLATGAVTSAGAAIANPAAFVAMVQGQTLNWAGLTTSFDPDNGATGGPVKVAFAQAISAVSPAGNEAFFYAAEDTDVTVTQGAAPTSFAGVTSALNGRVALYTPVGATYGLQAAFILGCAASTNWSATNGNIDYKFRSNPNLTPVVTDLTISTNLDANGYNYYAAVATRNQTFQYLRQGQISGNWDWIDEYVAQIYLNSQLQLALLEYETNTPSGAPYNQSGYASLRGVLKTPIQQAVTNGTIESGVVLSSSQIQSLIQAIGSDQSSTLYAQGWYLQILDPGAQVRGVRGTPVMTFWYTSGGFVHQLTLSSTLVQ